MVSVFRIKPCKNFSTTVNRHLIFSVSCDPAQSLSFFLFSLPPSSCPLTGSCQQLTQYIFSLFGALSPHHLALATCSPENILFWNKVLCLEEALDSINLGECCFKRWTVLSLSASSLILVFFDNRIIETFYQLIAYGLK